MGNSKIKLKIGAICFQAEGTEVWLNQQMDKFIGNVEQISNAAPPIDLPNSKQTGSNKPDKNFNSSLKKHIDDKNVSSQNDRFLATADWLRRKGSQSLDTKSISKALKDNQQSKLSNPSDCLNQNVGKGFCEKTSNGFFITPEGLGHLGYK